MVFKIRNNKLLDLYKFKFNAQSWNEYFFYVNTVTINSNEYKGVKIVFGMVI